MKKHAVSTLNQEDHEVMILLASGKLHLWPTAAGGRIMKALGAKTMVQAMAIWATRETASQTKPLPVPTPKDYYSLSVIQRVVCEFTGVLDLSSQDRTRIASGARQLFYFLGARYAHATIVDLSRATRRDHSTVIAALRAFTRAYEAGLDMQVRSEVDAVTRLLPT